MSFHDTRESCTRVEELRIRDSFHVALFLPLKWQYERSAKQSCIKVYKTFRKQPYRKLQRNCVSANFPVVSLMPFYGDAFFSHFSHICAFAASTLSSLTHGFQYFGPASSISVVFGGCSPTHSEGTLFRGASYNSELILLLIWWQHTVYVRAF